MTDFVTTIWVVRCDEQQQIKRLQQRDQLTETEAIARMQNQLPLSEKIKAADLVLDNTSTVEYLQRQIDTALSQLRTANHDHLGK